MTVLDRIMIVMDEAFDPHWGEAWSRRQVADSLAMPHTYALVIDDEGVVASTPTRTEPAGFALVRRAPGEEELLLIGIRPRFRRRGLAKRLLKEFFVKARGSGAERVFLEMRHNNPARILYDHMGFERIGTRRDYYRLGDASRLDAITYAKAL